MIANLERAVLISQISKLDWLKYVLEPMKYADFALLEFPIPAISDRERWKAALQHIEDAEKQYRSGNDPGVFSRCYAVYEVMKPIEAPLASVKSEDKREAIKKMLDGTRRFLNQGRHVERNGADAGEFPVDHRDAEFALCLTKASIAYSAKVVHEE